MSHATAQVIEQNDRPAPASEPVSADEPPPDTDTPPAPLDPPESPPAPPEPMPDSDDVEAFRDDDAIRTRSLGIVHQLFADIGIPREERSKRLAVTSEIVGRRITTSRELTRREGLSLVRVLNDIHTKQAAIAIEPSAPFGVRIIASEREGPDYDHGA